MLDMEMSGVVGNQVKGLGSITPLTKGLLLLGSCFG